MLLVNKRITIPVSPQKAFVVFTHSMNEWWPKEYTWSGEKLKEIRIEPHENGMCTEIGPHGFRCDWGRVTEINEPKRIVFKWQISPQRIPEPDPSKASEVEVTFTQTDDSKTRVTLEHRDFENHGENAGEYREAMNSEMGWEYILGKFKTACQN